MGGKVRFYHTLPFMTKQTSQFGCGYLQPDATKSYGIIDTKPQPQQN